MEPTKYYRSPHQAYRCGLANVGRPCPNGPLGRRCGQSQSDPETCYPIRTLYGWSRLGAWITTLFSLLFVLALLPTWKKKSSLVPGALSMAHAQLLHGTEDHSRFSIKESERCAACHPNVQTMGSKPEGHLASVKIGGQSQLCMRCHIHTIPNGYEGSPHDLTGEDLQELLATVAYPTPKKIANQTTECSQCHREHQGSGENLQTISSERCQACHRKQFESFSKGHPDLENYPEARPRSIAFDHGRHRDLHFAKKNATFDCRTCHLSTSENSVVGNVFRSVTFEQACAQCHLEPLRSAMEEGIAVIQLPSLDRRRLEQQGLSLGPWPEAASQIMDGKLAPLLIEWIATTTEGREVLNRLPRSGQLRDVDLNDRAQAENVTHLAELIRSQLQQLAIEGQPYLRRNLENQTAKYLEANPKRMAKYVSQDTQAPPSSFATVSIDAPRETMLSLWLNQMAGGVPPDMLRLAYENWYGKPAEGSNRLATRTIKQPTRGRYTRWQSSSDATDESLLLEPSKSPDSLLQDSDDLLSLPKPLDQTKAENSANPNTARSIRPLKAWEHLPYGGWFLDETRVAMVYVPQGHADTWLTRWLEWKTLQSNDEEPGWFDDSLSKQCLQCHSVGKDRIAGLFEGNPRTKDPSLVAFHPPDSPSSQQLNACWRIYQRSTAERALTRFSHTPHLTIPTLRDCQTCHHFQAQKGSRDPAFGWSQQGMIVHHEFESMQRSHCASCHTKQSAGDSCTQCHNYHVDLFSHKH